MKLIEQEDIDIKIKNLIDYELDKHISVYSKKPVIKTDRNEIYLTVADQLGVHKVMVRKVARKLMSDYIAKIQILNDIKKHNLKIKEV